MSNNTGALMEFENQLDKTLDKTIDSLSDKSFLFNDQSLNRYKETILKGIDLVQKKVSAVDKPFSGVLPHELAIKFEGVDLDQSFDLLSKALEEIEELYLNHAIYFHHPKYVAHLNCPIVMPAILAELILTSINSSLDTWDQSAGGTLIEQKLIDWTAEKIGLGPKADGIFTSGGTQSNLMATLLARDAYCSSRLGHSIQAQGLPDGYHKLRIFASQACHFSIQKAAAILGLGYEAVISVPCDDHFKMHVYELEKEIRSCFAQGLMPMAVVATVGTTDFGSIDPVMEIAEICRNYGLWMHTDAAYGCGLLISEKHRQLLDGIQYSDSVTVDYHKSFFQPVSCGAFFVRNKKNLSFFTHHADYLNPLSQVKEGTPNLVNKSIQTTRRFDALKLWLTLRTMGADNIGKAFDKVVALANETYMLLISDGTFDALHQPELSTLVFRYRPAGDYSENRIDEVNAYIRKALFRSGEAVVAGSKVSERQYLKFTLLNPMTTIHDIQEILNLIKEYGQRYFNQSSSRIEINNE